MIDKKEFESMKKDLELFEKKREEVIQRSRMIIKLSKQVIYGLHRDEDVSKLMTKMVADVKKLPAKAYDTDIARVARQEYVEAALFFSYVNKGKLASKKSLGVETEEYLLGICDLTGELMRKAVREVIRKKPEEAEKIRLLVEEIYGLFLELDLRNGELRKKSDQIKWNLSKLESIAYDMRK